MHRATHLLFACPDLVSDSNRFVHGFNCSGQSLQMRKCRFVADASVFARVLRSDESRLRIDDLKHGGLAAGVTQPGEAQAFAGSGDAHIERSELIAGGLGFGIGFIELRDQAALSRGESHFGGVALDLALLHLVLGGEPVPHRNIERDRGGVAEIIHSVGAVAQQTAARRCRRCS